jgi:hypothetical protein
MSKTIDEELFNRKLKKIREEKRKYESLVEHRELTDTENFTATSEKILELANKAESLWKSRNVQERLDFLKLILSNQALDGATLRYSLKKILKCCLN